MLIERERGLAAGDFERVGKLRDILNSQKNALTTQLDKKKRKAMRKLVKLAKAFQAIKKGKSIADKYFDQGSNAYAAILREGFSLERFVERFKSDPSSLTNYELYMQLIESIRPEYLNAQIDPDALLKSI